MTKPKKTNKTDNKHIPDDQTLHIIYRDPHPHRRDYKWGEWSFQQKNLAEWLVKEMAEGKLNPIGHWAFVMNSEANFPIPLLGVIGK